MKINKHLPVIIGFALVVGLSGLAYYLINRAKYNASSQAPVTSRQQALDIILKSGTGAIAASLSASSDAFLIAWAQAIQNGNNQFAANGASFNTSNGSAA